MSEKKKTSFQIPALGKVPMPTQVHSSKRIIKSQFKIPTMKRATSLAKRRDVHNSQLAPSEPGWLRRASSLGARATKGQQSFSVPGRMPPLLPAQDDRPPSVEMGSADEHYLERAWSQETIPQSPHGSELSLIRDGERETGAKGLQRSMSKRDKVKLFVRKFVGLKKKRKKETEDGGYRRMLDTSTRQD